jgi:hypothetical protein
MERPRFCEFHKIRLSQRARLTKLLSVHFGQRMAGSRNRANQAGNVIRFLGANLAEAAFTL